MTIDDIPLDIEVHDESTATGYPCFVVHGLSGEQKHDPDLRKAYCDLFQTAPKLLEALEELLVVIKANACLGLCKEDRAKVRKAEALIAKSEGTAP